MKHNSISIFNAALRGFPILGPHSNCINNNLFSILNNIIGNIINNEKLPKCFKTFINLEKPPIYN